ncbi:MAG: holo-ACP synthase [Oscillospiraceae bacterium]|nr:holo-ACP synthase [Oscillospiraceae bacterium]
MYGIGVDTATVARIEKSMKSEAFLKRVFSQEEQNLFLTKAHFAQTAAANFAAKEAFLKATGNGLGAFALCEIAALRKESGMPYFVFSGQAQAFMKKNGLTAHLSLTHEGGFATAFVVLTPQIT